MNNVDELRDSSVPASVRRSLFTLHRIAIEDAVGYCREILNGDGLPESLDRLAGVFGSAQEAAEAVLPFVPPAEQAAVDCANLVACTAIEWAVSLGGKLVDLGKQAESRGMTPAQLGEALRTRNPPVAPAAWHRIMVQVEHEFRLAEYEWEVDSHNVGRTRHHQSHQRGDARAKLIAALTEHHKYRDGGCLNPAPVGNNALARLAKVDRATASAFFRKEFKGHREYKAKCADPATLVAALKLLNGEFAPHVLYGSKPPGERERNDE